MSSSFRVEAEENIATHTPSNKNENITVRIGLETHVQLITRSKLFCSCKNPVTLKEEPAPNTLVCDVCLGMPGTKPVLNKRVVEQAIMVALALNADPAKRTFFSRKTYFYPDMNKNYQITQYEIPIASGGWVEIAGDDGSKKKIRIRRIHIEEDPAKLVHRDGYTLVDYNRAGIPLLEIVTEPDFSSPREARAYLQKLVQILEYLGVYDSTTQATIKSDANISMEYNGIAGERVELKNITGTREIERALSYEVIRQLNVFRRGGVPSRETRAWDENVGVSKSLRMKEEEEEYGYIFDPDLPVIEIDENFIGKIRKNLPELPDEKRRRFMQQYGLKEKTAESLTADVEIADLFEKLCRSVSVKNAVTWTLVLMKTLNYHSMKYREAGIPDNWMVELVKAYEDGCYSDVVTEEILRKMVEEKQPMSVIVEKYKYPSLKDVGNLEEIIRKVVKGNRSAVEDYKAGRKEAINFLVGQVMKETRGGADPKKVREILESMLNES